MFAKKRKRFGQSMVPEELFTDKGLMENRLLPYQYLKLIRIFRNTTPDDIDIMISAGYQARKLENIANTSWDKWLRFLDWLTTEDCQKFVAMKRRVSGDVFDVPDVNRLANFELQRNEMLKG